MADKNNIYDPAKAIADYTPEELQKLGTAVLEGIADPAKSQEMYMEIYKQLDVQHGKGKDAPTPKLEKVDPPRLTGDAEADSIKLAQYHEAMAKNQQALMDQISGHTQATQAQTQLATLAATKAKELSEKHGIEVTSKEMEQHMASGMDPDSAYKVLTYDRKAPDGKLPSTMGKGGGSNKFNYDDFKKLSGPDRLAFIAQNPHLQDQISSGREQDLQSRKDSPVLSGSSKATKE